MQPAVVGMPNALPAVIRFGSDSGRVTCRFDLERGERWAWEKEVSALPQASAPAQVAKSVLDRFTRLVAAAAPLQEATASAVDTKSIVAAAQAFAERARARSLAA